MQHKNKLFVVLFAVIFALMLLCTSCAIDDEPSKQKQFECAMDILNTLPSSTDYLSELNSMIENNESINVLVELNGTSVLDKFLAKGTGSVYDYIESEEAISTTNELTAMQTELLAAITEVGVEYTVRNRITFLSNIVSLNISAADYYTIAAMNGVKNITICEVYEAASVSADDVAFSTVGSEWTASSDLLNITAMREQGYGYNGKGTVIAIIDSGFNVDHETMTTYMPSKPIITEEALEKILPYTSAYSIISDPLYTAADYRANDKYAFCFDYADRDRDVIPDFFAVMMYAGEHGTHVAGLAAGNSDKFQGTAPDAQVLGLKVFSDSSTGAYSDDILAALSDAVLLHADVINMSLGSAAGFSQDADNYINEAYNKLQRLGISLCSSAGNSYFSSIALTPTNLPYTYNPDYSTVSSAASFDSGLAVASINSLYEKAFMFNGQKTLYRAAVNASSTEYDSIGMLLGDEDEITLEYVVVPGLGEESDYDGIDVNGKVALIKRGTLSFQDKADIAKNMGAVAVIFYNNETNYSIMGAQLTEMNIPTFCVKYNVGEDMAAASNKTVTFGKDMCMDTTLMSEFSSWGATPDLKLKPDITAPGGDVMSSTCAIFADPDTYGTMSGTSMASPNMTGLIANIRQYLKETYHAITDIELTETAYRIAMSSASIIYDEFGIPYSPRRQGSGLGDALAAVTTPAYISVTGSSYTKIEIGDDPTRSGIYTLKFNIVNMSENELSYDLSSIVLVDQVSTDGIYSELRSKLLNEYGVNYSVRNGSLDGNTVSIAANSKCQVKVVIELSESEMAYLNDNFENGTYVEGFICLESDENPDLSVPFLAFYGDWGDAEIFDISNFEEGTADTFVNYLLGVYGNMALYLGMYPYTLPEGMEAPTVTEDMIAISGQPNSLISLYGVQFGLKRNIGEMNFTLTDAVTGEVLSGNDLYYIRKCVVNGSTVSPVIIGVSINAIESDLPNNGSYYLNFTAKIDYDLTEVTDTVSFLFHVDFEAPTFNESKFEIGEDGRVYLVTNIFDNRYLMDFQIFNYDMDKEETGTSLFDYVIPVMNPVANSDVIYRIDVTEAINAMSGKYMAVFAEDYAFNKSGIAIEVDDEVIAAAAKFKTDAEMNFATIVENVATNMTVNVAADENGFVIENGVLTAYEGSAAEITIPDGVTAIANGVFKNKTFITKVTFNDGLKSIGSQAFMGCTGLTEITMPDSITEIGTESFSGLTNLVTLKLSANIKNISDKAFYNCKALKTVTYPTAYERVGDSAFYNCYALTNIDLPSTVKYIEQKAFYYSQSVRTLDLPVGIEYIKKQAFYFIGLNELVLPEGIKEEAFEDLSVANSSPFHYAQTKSIVMPDSWTRVPAYLCYYNRTLTSIKYPANVTEIGTSAFFYCISLETVNLPETVRVLNSYCYGYCMNVKEVTIPEGVEELPFRFLDKSLITTVTIPASVKSIGHQCFDMSTKLTEVIFTEGSALQIIDDYAFRESAFTSFNTPDTVVEIGNNAFQNCANLKDFHVSESLKSFGGNALYGTAIEELVIPESYDGWLNQLCYYMTSLRKITFKNNVTYVTNATFAGCTSLETIVFERNVYYALALCADLPALKEVEFKGDIEQIYGVSFRNCQNLKTLTFNNVSCVTGYVGQGSGIESIVFNGNVDSIELYAFQNMPNLKEIVLNGNLGSIGEYVFYSYEGTPGGVTNGLVGPEYLTTPNVKWVVGEDNPYLTLDENGILYSKDMTRLYKLAPGIHIENYVMPDSVTTIDNGAFAGRTDLVSITLGKGIKELPDYLFSGMENLETVDISNVTKLGEGVFMNCKALKNVTIPAAVTEVSAYLFQGCTALESVKFETAPTAIGAYAFANSSIKTLNTSALKEIGEGAFMNSAITSFVFPETLITIGESAFENTALSEIVLNNGLETIGNFAFENTGVEEIVLPDSLVTLGYMAFADCANLRYVFIGKNVEQFQFYTMFENCDNLAEVEISSENKYFTSIDGVVYTKDMSVLHFYSRHNTATEYVVPEGVIKIERQTFENNKYLASVELPESLIVIGDKAFYGCTALETVIFNGDAPVLEGCYDENHNYYYANFVDFIEDINVGLTLYCKNIESFDNVIWREYFAEIKVIGEEADDDTTNALVNSSNTTFFDFKRRDTVA